MEQQNINDMSTVSEHHHLNVSGGASHQHQQQQQQQFYQEHQQQQQHQQQAANSGIPHWLKRLRRIDRSLAAAVESSAAARHQAILGNYGVDDYDDAQQQQLDEFQAADISTTFPLQRSRQHQPSSRRQQHQQQQRASNSNLPLVSPNINSSPKANEHPSSNSVDQSGTGDGEPAPRPPNQQQQQSARQQHAQQQHKVNLSGASGGAAMRTNEISFGQQHQHNNNYRVSVPPQAVATCVICRATPREVSILEDEVARLRAFVTVQRESFQMQLDDIRESHSAEINNTRESAQVELNERLVAYRREVDELRQHLSMAEGVVVQFAKLKNDHADLSRRYETLLAASTAAPSRTTGMKNDAASAAAAEAGATTPADQKTKTTSAAASPATGATGGTATAADWEIEKMELLAELEHWKRQAVVAGVAAKTAVGAHLAQQAAATQSHSPAVEPRSPSANIGIQPQPHPGGAGGSTASSGRNSNPQQQQQYQRPPPTYTSSLPDAMNRLEAWRREVNPANSNKAQQPQPQAQQVQQPQVIRTNTRQSVSQTRNSNNVEVSPSTMAQQTPMSAARRNNTQAVYGAPEVMSSGGSSTTATSLYSGASGGQLESERQRWMNLMKNIVGGGGSSQA